MSMDGSAAARRSSAARKGAIRSAANRKCPACGRKAALSVRVDFPDGFARRCNYCGHEVGVTLGRSFGRDAESLARSRAKNQEGRSNG